ncbi:MAG: MFS transporter [Candidatus Thorarchaeota archaeon]|nr:MFS transporter [Candidatus Thorarchaeota archaeon]
MNEDQAEPEKKSLYTNPRVMVLALNAMLIMLGFGIIAPSMAFYLIALEGGLTQPPGPGYIVPPEVVAQFSFILGMMMAAFMGTRTLLARYWGGVSDRRGRRPIIVIGLMGYVLLFVLFGLAQNWIQLLLIRSFQGVVSAMVWPVAEAALMDIVGIERRGEGLGLYMLVSNIGFITGPGVGGLLYNFCRDVLLLPVPDVFRVPYFIAALITFPAVISTYVVLRETIPVNDASSTTSPPTEQNPPADDPPAVPSAPPQEIKNPQIRRMIHALYVMSLMNGIAMGMGQPLFQLFLMSKITTDIGIIGLIISGAGAVGMLFTVPAGRYSDKYGRKGLAVWGAVAARGSLFALPLTHNLAQTGGVWVIQNASMSASQPAMRAIQADIVPWNLRGKLFGTIQAFFNAGATIGPLVGGWLYGIFSLLVFQVGIVVIEGLVIPFWLSAGLGLIGVLLLWLYVDETRPQVVEEEEQETVKDWT